MLPLILFILVQCELPQSISESSKVQTFCDSRLFTRLRQILCTITRILFKLKLSPAKLMRTHWVEWSLSLFRYLAFIPFPIYFSQSFITSSKLVEEYMKLSTLINTGMLWIIFCHQVTSGNFSIILTRE